MNQFRKPHGSGGFGDRGPSRPGFDRPKFGGGQGGGFRRDGGGEKFDAICAQCGKPCQVPFRPNGKKPVYCSNCFSEQKQGGGAPQGAGQGSFNKDSFPRRDSFPAAAPQPRVDDRAIADLKRQIDVVASKVDVILKILENKAHTVAPVAAAKPVIAPAAPVAPVNAKKMLTTAGKELVKKKTAKKTKK